MLLFLKPNAHSGKLVTTIKSSAMDSLRPESLFPNEAIKPQLLVTTIVYAVHSFFLPPIKLS